MRSGRVDNIVWRVMLLVPGAVPEQPLQLEKTR